MMPSNKRLACMLIVCMLGLSVNACHNDSAPTTSATNDSARDGLQKTSHGAWQITAARATPTPTQGFAALMRALPAAEQARTRAWYQRIGGPSMDSATPAQVAWMQARHYPMPADIARAESMTTVALKAASIGDATARVLYLARLLNEYSAHASAAGTSNATTARLWVEISETSRRILASGSPYAGYLFAAQDRLTHPDVESNAATQLAGLVWASKFGDARANPLLNTPTMQAVDAATAASAINLMLTSAMYANPSLFSATIVPIPSSRP